MSSGESQRSWIKRIPYEAGVDTLSISLKNLCSQHFSRCLEPRKRKRQFLKRFHFKNLLTYKLDLHLRAPTTLKSTTALDCVEGQMCFPTGLIGLILASGQMSEWTSF